MSHLLLVAALAPTEQAAEAGADGGAEAGAEGAEVGAEVGAEGSHLVGPPRLHLEEG